MDKFFGGKDPFDHPFFTQPFGGFFDGKSPFDDPFFSSTFDNRSANRKQITIEELNPNDDVLPKSLPSFRSFSFQRVAYGGPNGIYYTSSVGKRTGEDGVFLMEMKEEDQTAGESLHTISKGLHDKGHSLTTKQCGDGRIDSLQTLHNINEDELNGFEESWKMNADKVLPGWSNGLLLENAGDNGNPWDGFASWNGWGGQPLFPSLEYFGNGETQFDDEPSSNGASRRIVPVE